MRLLACSALLLLLPCLLHALPVDKEEGDIGEPAIDPDPDNARSGGSDRDKRGYYSYGSDYDYSSTYSSAPNIAPPPMPPTTVIDHGAEPGGRSRVVGGCTEERAESVFCTREDAEGIAEFGLSKASIDELVAYHNQVRSQVRARNMQEMHWNEEISAYAQKWSQTCEKGHDTNKERRIKAWGVGMGQNWAGGMDIMVSAGKWAAERDIYTYNDSVANDGLKIGHYTQMVQAHCNAFGCGYSLCRNPDNGVYFQNFVCNYVYGQQSSQVQVPYIKAKRRKQKGNMCLEKTDTKLCKSTVICKHGGKFNVATGVCDCVAPYTLGEDCSIPDCSVPDADNCGSGVKIAENCDVYGNLPGMCRKMCGAC